MSDPILKLMIVAGEASGDLHAAKLINAIREAAPEMRLESFGCAGPRMRDAGVESVVDADDLSIVGLLEIAGALPMFLKAFRRLRKAAVERRPDVAVLVDFPDFNLKLARSLHRSGTKVVYYISPQLWAWRGHRIRTIRKHVDLVISILPFEKKWYSDRGVDHVEYVGSPLAREVHATRSKVEFCDLFGLDAGRPIVSMLPGSRHKEIVRILPPMLEAAAEVVSRIPRSQFVLAAASERHLPEIRSQIEAARADKIALPETLVVVCDETFNALHASDAAAVASGTATLEAGIVGTPMAIVYKTSQLNYKLLRPLIDVPHFGLINLIAGERIVEELIQDDFTAPSLAAELQRLLDPEVNSSVRLALKNAVDKLGHGGASKRAAALILQAVKQ